MRVVVVAGHPDTESFSHFLASSYADELRQAGHEVRVLDLAQADFDPVLRFGYRQRMEPNDFINYSQESLAWCEYVALFFPTWWTGVPSVLQGWFERCLTPRFAYQYHPDKLRHTKGLSGRKAMLVTSCHAPAWFARLHPAWPPQRIAKQVLGYCGITCDTRMVLGSMDGSKDTEQRRGEFMRQVNATVAQLPR